MGDLKRASRARLRHPGVSAAGEQLGDAVGRAGRAPESLSLRGPWYPRPVYLRRGPVRPSYTKFSRQRCSFRVTCEPPTLRRRPTGRLCFGRRPAARLTSASAVAEHGRRKFHTPPAVWSQHRAGGPPMVPLVRTSRRLRPLYAPRSTGQHHRPARPRTAACLLAVVTAHGRLGLLAGTGRGLRCGVERAAFCGEPAHGSRCGHESRMA